MTGGALTKKEITMDKAIEWEVKCTFCGNKYDLRNTLGGAYVKRLHVCNNCLRKLAEEKIVARRKVKKAKRGGRS